jgi:hypothetical protein
MQYAPIVILIQIVDSDDPGNQGGSKPQHLPTEKCLGEVTELVCVTDLGRGHFLSLATIQTFGIHQNVNISHPRASTNDNDILA